MRYIGDVVREPITRGTMNSVPINADLPSVRVNPKAPWWGSGRASSSQWCTEPTKNWPSMSSSISSVADDAGREVLVVGRFDRGAVEAHVRQELARWRELLTRNVQAGRQLLREALVGPLRFTPEGRAFRFEGEAAIGQLLAGAAALQCPS